MTEISASESALEATSSETKLNAFISYARADIAFADQLVAGLQACGFNPTLDRAGISGGER
jgi:hypothetical protein